MPSINYIMNSKTNINAPKANAVIPFLGVVDRPFAGGAFIFNNMKIITVNSKTHGTKEILVDDEDFNMLNKIRWYLLINRGKYINTFYVYSHKYGSMQRFLMNYPNNMQVDHKDRNTLNNQKNNLRICTKKENLRNRRSVPKTSKYLGVMQRNGSHLWTASINANKTNRTIGHFATEVGAALAYNAIANKLFGEFANPNIISEAEIKKAQTNALNCFTPKQLIIKLRNEKIRNEYKTGISKIKLSLLYNLDGSQIGRIINYDGKRGNSLYKEKKII